jgi:hypothetical protein
MLTKLTPAPCCRVPCLSLVALLPAGRQRQTSLPSPTQAAARIKPQLPHRKQAPSLTATMGTGTSTLLQQMPPLLPVGPKHLQWWGVSSTDSRSLIPALFAPVSWLLALKAAAALAACV